MERRVRMLIRNPLPWLKQAQAEGWAVPAFNMHNLETLQAIVDACSKARSPLILQTTPGTVKYMRLPYIAACVRAAAEQADIPIALHMDHASDEDMLYQGIKAGYSSLMVDRAHLPYDENVAFVRRVAAVGHAVDICMEGELGRIGGVEDSLSVDDREATMTVPEEAAAFVQATGIDTLAVAIGTAHGVYKGEPELDFDRLAKIKAKVSLPFVLHGASGVPEHQIKAAMRLGVCKINIATEIKIPLAEGIRAILADETENDPRKYMGEGRSRVMDMVREKVALFGAEGKAG